MPGGGSSIISVRKVEYFGVFSKRVYLERKEQSNKLLYSCISLFTATPDAAPPLPLRALIFWDGRSVSHSKTIFGKKGEGFKSESLKQKKET